jgi:hypothetical protein
VTLLIQPLKVSTHEDGILTVHLEQRETVSGDGVQIDQVLTVTGAVQIVADSRWYSNDLYRRAIAKFIEGHPRA